MPPNPASTETGIFESPVLSSGETGIFTPPEEKKPGAQTLDIADAVLDRAKVLERLLPGVVGECAKEASNAQKEGSFVDRFRVALERHERVQKLIGKERGILHRALTKIVDLGTPQSELEGLIIGSALVGKKIGNGGFGDTYEAVIDGKSVVIKVDAPKSASPDVVRQASARFVREVEVMEQIDEGVPKILGKGRLRDGKQFFVMERIHGHTLHDILRCSDGEPLPPRFANDVLALVARLLTVLHKKGISHRDIKPQNIMIDHQGRPYLIDFGFGKALEGMTVNDLTASGQMMGTPDYMSPEQVEDSSTATTDSDNYSLGILAYKLHEGQLPFAGDTIPEILAKRLSPPPPMQKCSDAKTQRTIVGLLERNPDLRKKSEDAGRNFFDQSSFASKNGGRYKTYNDFLNALHANLKIAMPDSFPEEHAVHLGAIEVASAEFIHLYHKNRQHSLSSAPSKYSLPRIAGGSAGVLAFTLAVGAVVAMMFRDGGGGEGDSPIPAQVKPVDPDPLKQADSGLGKKDNNGAVIPPKITPEKLPKKQGILQAAKSPKGWSYSLTLGEGLPPVEYPRDKGQHYERFIGKTKEPAGSSMMYDKEFLAQMEGVSPDELPDYMTKDILGKEVEVIAHKYFASGHPDRPALFITNKALILPDLRKKEDRAEGDPETVAFADDEFVNMRIVQACSSKDREGREKGIYSFEARRDHPVYQAFFSLCPLEGINTLPGGNTSGSRRAPGWLLNAWRGNLDTFKHK